MSLLIYNQRQQKSKKVSLKQALTRTWEKDLKSGAPKINFEFEQLKKTLKKNDRNKSVKELLEKWNYQHVFKFDWTHSHIQ